MWSGKIDVGLSPLRLRWSPASVPAMLEKVGMSAATTPSGEDVPPSDTDVRSPSSDLTAASVGEARGKLSKPETLPDPPATHAGEPARPDSSATELGEPKTVSDRTGGRADPGWLGRRRERRLLVRRL